MVPLPREKVIRSLTHSAFKKEGDNIFNNKLTRLLKHYRR